ncbi:HD-GYP domain-containing protein [Alkaliphilus peptidifermentans]|uniref:HDIG domain-containing protein n=1 Tax=Alkaliphilus peptidifermentans DSM 18978 TaxID=1120976 RepID=A0A1G5ICY3_9FIRM|nr:HD-GYP domain-containing protein [Alkaliphilus peptidifermentans]SCY73621.1 HDIG domain-containing protein [Alkaliphilus peptidifermentans DSM 18978]
MEHLPKNARLYIIFIISLAFIFGILLLLNYTVPTIQSFLLFLFLSFLMESMAVLMPNGVAVSVGYAVDLTTMIVLGPLGAALCSCFGMMLRYTKVSNEDRRHIGNTPLYKTLFNGSQCLLSIGLASIVYYSFNTSVGDPFFYLNIVPLFTAILTYLIINTSIMTKLFSILHKQSFKEMFVNNIKWTLPNSFVIATLGIFISILYLHYGSMIMLLFFGPLMLARHSFKMYLDMKNLYMETVYALTKAVEAKDPYTDGHSKRVAELSVRLGEFMDLPQQKIETIKTAALLHDIGKIGIEDSILNKAGKLNDYEIDKIKSHPAIGVNILNEVDFLKDVKLLIYCHHERYDGNGYPDRLGGDDVPKEAYILSVADAFDAMTSDRSYRKAMEVTKALSIIQEEAGRQFHPEIASLFLRMLQMEEDKNNSEAITI